MFGKIFDAFFGCWHNNLSFPLTARSGSRRSAAASLTGTYVVCLDCGREFAYDWREMKIIDHLPKAGSPVPKLAPKQAA
jgi:predicted protein tyrosine phosphatase